MKFTKISICISLILLIQMGASGQTEIGINKLGIKDVTPKWLNIAPNKVFVDGDYLYAIDGNFCMHIYNISIPDNPVWVNVLDDIFVSDAFFRDNYAFLACPFQGFYIVDIHQPEKAQIVKKIESTDGNEPFGDLLWSPVHIAVKGDYAFITVEEGDIYKNPTYGLKVFNINPVENASLVTSIELPHLGGVFKINGNHACIADMGGGFLDIDISSPESPKITKQHESEKEPRGHYLFENSSIEIDNGYLYICAGKDGLKVIDIDPVEEMHEVVIIPTPDAAITVSVINGYAYVGSGYDKFVLHIIDIDPITEANLVGSVKQPSPANVAVKGNYAYIANAMNGLQVVNVENPGSAKVVHKIESLTDAADVFISNGYAYLLFYQKGLKIVDIDPIESAKIVASLDLPEGHKSIYVSNDVALISSNGLYIIDVSRPENPEIIKIMKGVGGGGIIVSGDYVFFVRNGGIKVVDIDPPKLAFVVKEDRGFGEDIAFLSDDRIYTFGQKLEIIDISNPLNPTLIQSTARKDIKEKTEIFDGFTFIPLPKDYRGKSIIDVKKMNLHHIIQFRGSAMKPIYLFDDYAIIFDTSDFTIFEKDAIFEEKMYDLENILFRYGTMGMISDVFYSDGKLYIADYAGFKVFEL